MPSPEPRRSGVLEIASPFWPSRLQLAWTMSLTVGSLFSGIGGLDLGLERAGMTVKWQCEVDPFCSQVLAKHWPDVPNLGDVTKVDWEGVERVDLICGGYPCQPFSTASAGRRLGEADERHLWPYMRDALGVLRPRFALLENVSGHLSLGFGAVLGDLAALGYDAEWDCIPAAAVGAPHRRDRVFLVAHADESRERVGSVDAEASGSSKSVADSNGRGRDGWSGRRQAPPGRRQSQDGGVGVPDTYGVASDGSAIAWGERGHWTTEPDVGRVAHGIPRRVDRLRALGNAVVPQVAQFVGEQLLASLGYEVSA